jgi:hypothetical protein
MSENEATERVARIQRYFVCHINDKQRKVLSENNTEIELETIMLNEISQAEKDKYAMTSLICGI